MADNAKIQKKIDLLDLLNTYRKRPVLWSGHQNQYTNKQAREAAYDDLLKKYKRISRGATMEKLKVKLSSIRSSYKREYDKCIQTRLNGEPFETNLWYFQHLLFLDNEYDPEKAHQEVLKLKKRLVVTDNAYDFETCSNQIEQNSSSNEFEDEQHKDNENFASTISHDLKELEPMQRSMAEKLISEIVVNARQGNLRWLSKLELQ